LGSAEAAIEGHFVRRAVDVGMAVRKVKWVNRRGAPDRFVAYKGKTAFIEFKSEIGVLSKLQKHEIKELRSHQVLVLVIDSKEGADKVIDWLLGKNNKIEMYT